jgi:hypothetical protein
MGLLNRMLETAGYHGAFVSWRGILAAEFSEPAS